MTLSEIKKATDIDIMLNTVDELIDIAATINSAFPEIDIVTTTGFMRQEAEYPHQAIYDHVIRYKNKL